MRSRIFFTAIALLLYIVMSPSMLLGLKSTRPNLSLKQKVDLELSNLNKNVKKARTIQQKLKFVNSATDRIKNLRTQAAKQMEPEELYIDVLMASLEEIPRENFKRDHCEIYKQNIISKYDPAANDRSQNPAVKKTVGVLKSLCK
jgi:hypothetical protein